ncbi:MAG: ATP-binding protein [Ktedonobacteraceae bacterium]|jgi:hypothetical protein|nr:ATP-binding protein [Ktedonobacteraceae bacterium]
MRESTRKFDLNIERVLEHWTVAHALREVIANALDEAALSGTAEPSIFKDEQQVWHIKDHGRGLRYTHLTQKEDQEKLRHPELVIGKFGVGLKDALATFDRHHITVQIFSPHGDITVGAAPKHDFDDLKTLHALIHPPSDPQRIGTEFLLTGIKDAEMAQAKDFFLQYSGDEVIAKTAYGTILRHDGKQQKARIYVNGLLVAEEERFLFSYNITSLTASLRKALNRERTNVGRGAYSDRVKTILLACEDTTVADALAQDLQNLEHGTAHDELQWLDVQLHACRILNARRRVVFVTAEQLRQGGSLITHAQQDGYRIVVIPSTLAFKLPTLQDINGQQVRTLDNYRREWDDSFQFTFIPPDQLTPTERAIYDLSGMIMRLLTPRITLVKEVLISETMRMNNYDNNEAVGVWEEEQQRIVIKRSQLQRRGDYAATLLHEYIHALSGADDQTLVFEEYLTQALGVLADRFIDLQHEQHGPEQVHGFEVE